MKDVNQNSQSVCEASCQYSPCTRKKRGKKPKPTENLPAFLKA